jgi:ornithine cyclodeaminase/alanine dehydrogenase-like protein (mu-crystallin family)
METLVNNRNLTAIKTAAYAALAAKQPLAQNNIIEIHASVASGLAGLN